VGVGGVAPKTRRTRAIKARHGMDSLRLGRVARGRVWEQGSGQGEGEGKSDASLSSSAIEWSGPRIVAHQ
jgi:hypothetical protein